MVNRYAGEIHINPVRILRGDDFNNDGHIKDIEATLKEAIALNQEINDRLQKFTAWLRQGKAMGGIQFHFADGGYISVKGLADAQLQQLHAKGLIELFDYATDRDWVKKYGVQFGLIWEGGRAVEI
jgi:maltose-binding protein MalE